MISTECGKVIEFVSPEIESLQDQMADKLGFRLSHHSLRMWGQCAECQEKVKDISVPPSGAQPKVRVKTGSGKLSGSMAEAVIRFDREDAEGLIAVGSYVSDGANG